MSALSAEPHLIDVTKARVDSPPGKKVYTKIRTHQRKRRGNVTLIHADDLWQPDDTIICLTTLPLSKAQKALA